MPFTGNENISRGDVQADLGSKIQAKKERTSGGSGSNHALGVAKVITVNYEEFTVTLRVILGADQEFQRVPVPITFPGAGTRHFFGALPMMGDHCIIGHLTQETHGGTTTPVVLGWIIPGTWTGHDWLVTQSFSPEEYSFDSKDSSFVEGVFERVRHKLPHMGPGNIVCSSAQGSDIFLNEDVYISNRRGNEIKLRDSDQALVTRSLQSFQVMAGARVYAGMVQRDATLLPSQMFSTGKYWESSQQLKTDNRTPLSDDELATDPHPIGMLTPNSIFDRLNDDNATISDVNKSGVMFEADLDPYNFLERGLFITPNGYVYDDRVQGDATYGGKSFYRTSILTDNRGRPLNSVIGTGDQGRALTEYRIEVTHTSDGQLPITEQTEGLDAERLPRSSPTGEDPQGLSENSPFLQVVYGSVIGNDPFSLAGRNLYGLPLKPIVFKETGAADPKLDSAIGTPLGEHAASLFHMTPPLITGGLPTFWSVTKDGRMRFAIEGPLNEPYSIEGSVRSGARFEFGGEVRVRAEKGFHFDIGTGSSTNKYGLNLCCNDSAVRVFGGANTTEGALAKRTAPTGGGELDQMSLVLEGLNNTLLKSGRRILLNSNDIEARSTRYSVQAQNIAEISAGDRVGILSKQFDLLVNGKSTQSFQGYKDGLPTNGSFRSTKFTGVGLGVVDEYSIQQGDRVEEIQAGNHSTTISVGNMTYETKLGAWKAIAGSNELVLDSIDGFDASIQVGNVALNALSGSATLQGLTSVTVKTAGAAILSGSAGVTLGGPGKVGGIVSASDIDPLTGLPLGTFGMGSPGHTLGPAI